MNRQIGYALLAVSLLTLLVWAISQFVQPILPSNLNSGLLLFFAALLAVIGALAGFKDVIELFGYFARNRSQGRRGEIERINLGSRFFRRPNDLLLTLVVHDPHGQITGKFTVIAPATISLEEMLARIRKRKPGMLTEVDYSAFVVGLPSKEAVSGFSITNGTTIIIRPKSING